MKKRLLLAFLLVGALKFEFFAQTTVPANAKSQQAIDLGLFNPSTDQEMIALNTRAEKLCWVEDVKTSVNEENVFVLTTHMGEEVSLTLPQLLSINPLLYELPQKVNQCENLIVQTTDGTYHLLVVRSETMMQNEIKRATLQSK
jgi:hypothetical protein